MTGGPETTRHLDRAGLEDYLSTNAPATLKIDGQPAVYLVIDPVTPRLALRTTLGRGGMPDLSGYRNISTATVYWEDRTWCELSAQGAIARDAYPLLCAIADRLQLQSLDFRQATADSLKAFKELLAHRDRLSDEEETGLFGELLVLRHLMERVAPDDALSMWQGPAAAEHDFDLGGSDAEVKTTTAESRRHWIGSAEQLAPTVGRCLWLISIQLTEAGVGAFSLPLLIEDTEKRLPEPRHLETFRLKLQAMSWRPDASASFTRRFRLRTPPSVFLVDDGFPSLTPPMLRSLSADAARIVQLRYLVDLTGLPSAMNPPDVIAAIADGISNG